jgi:methyl-branched lipid omega-hydroxylase
MVGLDLDIDGEEEAGMSTVPTPTTTLSLDEINPASFDFWLRDDVEGALAKLRHERPVAWHQHPDSGKGFWSITRFDDVAAVTRDWETFSSAHGIQVMLDPEDAQYMSAIRSMISTDPPKHTKLRSVVNRGFTPKMIAKAEGAVRQRARRIVDTIAPKGEAEFVTEVADALPVAIICDMMGVPESDRTRLLDLTNRLLAGGDKEFGGTRESLLQAAGELRDYGLWLGQKRLEHPEDDLTTTLVHAEVDGEAMPPEDLGPFFLLLIAAGNETTRTAISHALKLFSDFPDQRALLLEDFEGRIGGAVEEIVRYSTPVIFMRRNLTRDYEMNGHTFTAGDKVLLFYNSANRDEAVFDDPYVFDITRRPNPHVGFGGPGAHFCLGANLARREISVMLRELFTRLPDIRTAGEPDRLLSGFINGYKRLPCTFTKP